MVTLTKVGIVSAVEREVWPLVRGWKCEQFEHNSRRFRVFKKAAVSYMAAGIGREQGLRATEALTVREKPDLLVSAGFAGALVKELAVGDVVKAGTVIDEAAGEAFQTHWNRGGPVLVSAMKVLGAADKRRLAQRFGAQAVDMEGASVARIAKQHGIPFCGIKTITDELDFVMPPFNDFVHDGELQTGRFMAYAAFRPRYWPSIVRLGMNTSRASRVLVRELREFIEEVSASPRSTIDENSGMTSGCVGSLKRTATQD